MSYIANLTDNQKIAIANQGNQTNITLISISAQQQQSQSSSFTTGVWQTLPQLYRVGTSYILKLNGDRGTFYLSIQSSGISGVTPPNLDNAIALELQEIKDSATVSSNISFEPMQPMTPMQPMQPMQPMKMGNMSMDINSMSMQMGNMSLNMNNTKTPTPTRVFCSQCGQEAKMNDRFCKSCGHKLDS